MIKSFVVFLFVLANCATTKPVVRSAGCVDTVGLIMILTPEEAKELEVNPITIISGGCRCAIVYETEEYVSVGPLEKGKCNVGTLKEIVY